MCLIKIEKKVFDGFSAHKRTFLSAGKWQRTPPTLPSLPHAHQLVQEIMSLVRRVGVFDLLRGSNQNNVRERLLFWLCRMLSTSFLVPPDVRLPSRSFLARKRVTTALETYVRSDICVYEHLTSSVRFIRGPTSLPDPGLEQGKQIYPQGSRLLNYWKSILGLSDPTVKTNRTIAGSCTENTTFRSPSSQGLSRFHEIPKETKGARLTKQRHYAESRISRQAHFLPPCARARGRKSIK